MKFKLVLAMVSDDRTEIIIEQARKLGATGATVINASTFSLLIVTVSK